MPKKIPTEYMNTGKPAPDIPRGGYPPDYKDDWIDIVARRLIKRFPDFSRAQRRVLASVAFDRRYRGKRDILKLDGIDAKGRPVILDKSDPNPRHYAITKNGNAADITLPLAEVPPYHG